MPSEHPNQPTITDDKGVLRFKSNKIIEYLFNRRLLDLNVIATMGFSDEDRRQLAQLLGYSVDGYNTLSYVEGHEQ